jgi:hypothetical protein
VSGVEAAMMKLGSGAASSSERRSIEGKTKKGGEAARRAWLPHREVVRRAQAEAAARGSEG